MSEKHLLKFAKAVIYLPDPVRSKPLITDEHRAKAAESPPHPVPFHCKPWVDGQTIGYTIFYGFLTPIEIVGLPGGRVHVENAEALFAEARVTNQTESFAPGFFSFSTGYTFKTEPGMVCLMMPPTKPPAGFEMLTAVVETDWFPKEVFVAVKVPPEGERIQLEFGMELARIVVVPRMDSAEITPMSPEEVATIRERETAYREDEATTDSKWAAATGDTFTHVYKQWARKNKMGRRGDGETGRENKDA